MVESTKILADSPRINLTEAIHSYAAGKPVVVMASDGSVLHGEETLKGIAELEISLSAKFFYGIDRTAFEATDWPELLEGARRAWLEKGTFERPPESWLMAMAYGVSQ
jgi:hypothetical protein